MFFKTVGIWDFIWNLSKGELVEVFGENENYLATAFMNPNSKILGRIISRERVLSLDTAFFKKQLLKARSSELS